jgi:hypothetical protein
MRMISSLRSLLFVLVVLAMSTAALSQVSISVGFGPPALPIYEQPVCPGDGYIWTPGYWAWDGDDYYWVPGTWVLAPEVGFLWTPPWWGWSDGVYLFHEGWWGPQVGFYGGVVYGFGYFGYGFEGGRWEHDHFFYNRSVTNINVVNIHNVYNENVVNRYTDNHISYNGGPGGIEARPRPEDERAAQERHIPPARAQVEHEQAARSNRELHASANQGRPPIAATARPGEFRSGVTPAREAGAPYHPPANRGGTPARGEPTPSRGETNAPRGESNASRPAVHPKELPAIEHPAAPNTGNAQRDQKYQQQQDKMLAKQQQERQNLQQKQEQEHQRAQQQNANQARQQQMEQRHQQQTQQLQQKHVQQQQRMTQKQQPPPAAKHK